MITASIDRTELRKVRRPPCPQRRGDSLRAGGDSDLRIGERRERLPAGGVAVIPAKVAHESVNAGRETLRFLVIFPSAVVLHNWDVPVEPFGTRRSSHHLR